MIIHFLRSDGFFFAVKEVSLLDQGDQGRQSIYQLEQVRSESYFLGGLKPDVAFCVFCAYAMLFGTLIHL